MAEDLISSIIDEAAIQKQVTGLEAQLDILAKRLKEFPTLGLGGSAGTLKDLINQNNAYKASLDSLSTTQNKVLSAEKLAAIERKRIADERTQQARTAAAELKLQQIEIKKKQIAEAEAAVAAKQAAAEATAAGRERILQLKAEQAELEKSAQLENARNNAEQQALSGTYNPGSVPKSQSGASNAVPLTVDQGNIVLIKTYQAEVAKLVKEEAALKAAFQSGKITYSEYAKQVAVSTEKINALKRGISDVTREQKLSDAVSSAERNSLQRAQALVAQYTNSKKSLNLATEDGRRLNENYNKAIQKSNEFILKNADAETQRTKNIGNYGSALNKILGPIRTLANILPGIGLSGIFLLGFEAIQKVVESLGIFSSRVFGAKEQLALLRDINKEMADSAGSEIAKLETLYKVATNTNLTVNERKKAVDELQKQYPDYFKNLSDEVILQGQAAKAYDATKTAILQISKTRAIESELGKLASEDLEKNFKRQEIMNNKLLNDQKAKIEEDKKAAGIKDSRDSEQRGLDQFGVISKGTELVGELDNINKDLEKNSLRREFLLNQITTADTKIGSEPSGTKAKKAAKEQIDSAFEVFKIQKQFEIDQSKSVVDNDKETFNARLLFLQTYLSKRFDLINATEDHEIKAAKGNKDKLKIIEAKFQDERARLAIEGQGDFEKIRDQKDDESDKKTLKRQEELNARLHEILKNFVDTQAALKEKDKKDKEDKNKEAEKKEKEFLQRRKELYKQLYSEIQQTIFQFLDDGLKREEQNLDERKRLLDEDTKKRINNVNQLGLTEVERVKQTSLIEKNAQFQTEQIEAKKRAIAVQRAKYEKAANIASIISNTALAVVKALDIGPPQGFVLAALVGAIGALQLARAISTPLPKYAVGTQSAKPGHGIFGEEGREMVIPIHGKPYLSPAVASINTFVGGETIVPAKMTKALLAASGFGGLAGMDSRRAVTQDNINNHLSAKMLSELKDINRKSRIIINNTSDIKTTAWYQHHYKN